MTNASPVPVHPRLGVRAAYRLQQVLRPNGGYRWLSARIEAASPARVLFTATERQAKQALFGLWTGEGGANPRANPRANPGANP